MEPIDDDVLQQLFSNTFDEEGRDKDEEDDENCHYNKKFRRGSASGSVFADDVSGPADGYSDYSDDDATQPLTQKPKQSHPENKPLSSGPSDNIIPGSQPDSDECEMDISGSTLVGDDEGSGGFCGEFSVPLQQQKPVFQHSLLTRLTKSPAGGGDATPQTAACGVTPPPRRSVAICFLILFFVCLLYTSPSPRDFG